MCRLLNSIYFGTIDAKEEKKWCYVDANNFVSQMEKAKHNCIVCGRKGFGKTALLTEFSKKVGGKSYIKTMQCTDFYHKEERHPALCCKSNKSLWNLDGWIFQFQLELFQYLIELKLLDLRDNNVSSILINLKKHDINLAFEKSMIFKMKEWLSRKTLESIGKDGAKITDSTNNVVSLLSISREIGKLLKSYSPPKAVYIIVDETDSVKKDDLYGESMTHLSNALLNVSLQYDNMHFIVVFLDGNSFDNKVKDIELSLQWNSALLNKTFSERLRSENVSLDSIFIQKIPQYLTYEIVKRIGDDKEEVLYIGQKPFFQCSWDYILSYTLFRPRDIIAFLLVCQKEFPYHTKIGIKDLKTAFQKYSEGYFITEILEEMRIFFSISLGQETFKFNQIVTDLLCSLGKKYEFVYSDFCDLSNNLCCLIQRNPSELFNLFLRWGVLGVKWSVEEKQLAENKVERVIGYRYAYDSTQILRRNEDNDETSKYSVHKAIMRLHAQETLPSMDEVQSAADNGVKQSGKE